MCIGTLAVRRQEMASFLTSSIVGSKCVLYLARGCHLSYCAWRFFPAQQIPKFREQTDSS